MLSANRFTPELPPPVCHQASREVLYLESTLAQLSQYEFSVDMACLGRDVAQQFEAHPHLPGVIVQQHGQFVGMISRQRLLEYLLRPHGVDLFLSQPLTVLYSYARTTSLILPQQTSIVLAAQQAFRRSPEHQAEPIVVQVDADHFRVLDVHELQIAYWQIRGIETQVRYERTQAMMIQSEKMAGLGRLVDGVAHEILDPVGFIWGNLAHISTYTAQVLELLAAYEAHVVQPPAAIAQLQQEIELDYVRHDLPRAIESVRAGADRLKRLASSLQNFCHIDDVYPKPANLHECLDSIVLLLKERLTGEIEIVRHYGQLPPVQCYIGQLSQVFMNILTNAIDVLLNQAVYEKWTRDYRDRVQADGMDATTNKPQITITTRVRSLTLNAPPVSRWVSICITNNGPSLSEAERQRILDSFTVERRAEKETSLAVSYQIITAKHGGKFNLRSPAIFMPSEESVGMGTEFEILLPLL
ncbi:sensor histidine kinase [Leptolyngbya sp. AN02str]|uniref:sensor histidine kinase n=1 Tax=Leptolyngbya sp. AN02str TaxID=3423363 RepID=UPI003D31E7C1